MFDVKGKMLSKAKSGFDGDVGGRNERNVIVIVGPTCSGKTTLSLNLLN